MSIDTKYVTFDDLQTSKARYLRYGRQAKYVVLRMLDIFLLHMARTYSMAPNIESIVRGLPLPRGGM